VHGGYGFTDEFPVVAVLSRRPLRHVGRRHDRDAERPVGRRVLAESTRSTAFLGLGAF